MSTFEASVLADTLSCLKRNVIKQNARTKATVDMSYACYAGTFSHVSFVDNVRFCHF